MGTKQIEFYFGSVLTLSKYIDMLIKVFFIKKLTITKAE